MPSTLTLNTIIEYTLLNMTILIILTDTTWKNVILVQCDTIETLNSIFSIDNIITFCNSKNLCNYEDP